jgi:hypothetical protein
MIVAALVTALGQCAIFPRAATVAEGAGAAELACGAADVAADVVVDGVVVAEGFLSSSHATVMSDVTARMSRKFVRTMSLRDHV